MIPTSYQLVILMYWRVLFVIVSHGNGPKNIETRRGAFKIIPNTFHAGAVSDVNVVQFDFLLRVIPPGVV